MRKPLSHPPWLLLERNGRVDVAAGPSPYRRDSHSLPSLFGPDGRVTRTDLHQAVTLSNLKRYSFDIKFPAPNGILTQWSSLVRARLSGSLVFLWHQDGPFLPLRQTTLLVRYCRSWKSRNWRAKREKIGYNTAQV